MFFISQRILKFHDIKIYFPIKTISKSIDFNPYVVLRLQHEHVHLVFLIFFFIDKICVFRFGQSAIYVPASKSK